MKENFLNFELSKNLHEKGFTLKHPFAMYDESGRFHALFTSADKNKYNKSIFGNRDYYDYDDFDCNDIPAPTIEQTLKWLREECKIHVQIEMCGKCYKCSLYGRKWFDSYLICRFNNGYQSYEQAVIAGIEYALNKLI